uniref:Uncharacterized protein n=1 Tax=Pelusios castaneus TaxID=367368 RepID=A0A8C8RNZ8_9SAUR
MRQDTLFHGKALFIITTTDADNISLISSNFRGHPLLIERTFWQPVKQPKVNTSPRLCASLASIQRGLVLMRSPKPGAALSSGAFPRRTLP